MKKLISLVCLTVLLISCHKDEEEQTPQTRTVVVYMSAENRLSYYAESDMAEMKEGSKSISDNDNLIVYCDRAVEGELPWLGRIKNGVIIDSVSIADMQISNKDELASSPHIFEKVLSYAYSHYPATDGYGLVLWGHASGWLVEDSVAYTRGYGVDNGSNSSRFDGTLWLNIPTIRRVLEKQPHLSFIFADCCNFMCLESIYELRNVTDYVIGSPAEIPDMGAPYTTVVPAMFDHNNFVNRIIDNYYVSNKDYLPLSAVKTSEMENLATATSTALKTIYNQQGSDYPDLTGLIHYYNEYSSRFLPSYSIFYDAGDFILKYAPTEAYQVWKQVFDRAIVDKRFATSWMTNKSWGTHYSDFTMTTERFHGVSIFIPQDPQTGFYRYYNQRIESFLWHKAVWQW